ncbi:MAG: hypothetical protein HYV37_03155 [Candidatus Levyibacteriota bacterium]|nr:MAG: hypothetical protein HYV37_03155 [Candidatus Levybacteria bacterium]
MRIIFCQKGQSLITLLFFMIIAITIISASVVVTLVNTQSTSRLEITNNAYVMAENGAEDAILKLLRNPDYTGESFSLGEANIITQVSGTNTKAATIEARLNGFIRKIQVNLDYSNNILRMISWKEVL